MPLSKDLREFIECLNSNRAEYLVVGAVVGALAVSWYGFPRYSARTWRLGRFCQRSNRALYASLGHNSLN
jgi:hypothetical protein